MIQMKWRADSENSENSALDTIIVTHKIYEKKYFLIGLTLVYRYTWYIYNYSSYGILIEIQVKSPAGGIKKIQYCLHPDQQKSYFYLCYFLDEIE